jgi:predicted TIM-barrel fold metal-dependent hydrolase
MRNPTAVNEKTVRNLGKEMFAPSESGTSRRGFLKALAVAGATAVLPASGLLAQGTSSGNRVQAGRIDVHHHMYPPEYLKAVANPNGRGGGGGGNNTWTPQTSIDKMDRAGVATAMLSPVQRVVSDTMSGKDQKTRDLIRMNNEYGARCVHDNPKRFGHFAALPMMDVDGSLKEIEYAYGTLKADGIGLWTSYLDKWIGSETFWPIYEELNRRNAVVFYHPAHNTCCRNIPDLSGTIAFDLDTTQAIDSMLFSGTVSKYPNVRHIWSHAGGGFTVLAPREMDDYPKNRMDRLPNGVDYEIKKMYWDTAHAGQTPTIDALKALVPVSQILYGSDVPLREYPLTDGPLDNYPHFSEDDWKAVNRGNSEKLFPRLKA